MEIGRIRKELTELLDNITEHSNKYSDERTIPSLEVGVVLTKVNRVQEKLAVLRHLLEQQEFQMKQERRDKRQLTREPVADQVTKVEEKETPVVEVQETIAPIIEETIIEENVSKTQFQ